jgi:hypothetical protein
LLFPGKKKREKEKKNFHKILTRAKHGLWEPS